MRVKHGDSYVVVDGVITRRPEYDVWRSVIQRCCNPRAQSYKNYGGRGVTVCEEWRNSYSSFLSHVGRRPSHEHSLDRFDNNGNYEPGNVRWATRTEQLQNTRRNRNLTIDGETRCIAEWARLSGTEFNTITRRLARGRTPKDAVFTPPRKCQRSRPCLDLTINGETKRIARWAEISPVGHRSIRDRLSRGWSPYEAVFAPRSWGRTSRKAEPLIEKEVVAVERETELAVA